MLDNTQGYSKDIFTQSYGARLVAERLTERYGQKYLDYRAAWARTESFELPDFPLNLSLDLVDKCNLSCPQCLRSVDLIKEYKGFLGTSEILTTDSVIRAFDECYDHGMPSLNIGGSGEPTMHQDIAEICKAAMDRDILELRLITNGLRLDQSLSEALIDMQAHFLSVSIDAISAETFGVVRGKAHRYQQVVDNILRFLEIRKRNRSIFPLLRVTFVSQPDNRHEKEDFIEFWSKHSDMIDVQSYHDFRATDFNHEFDCTEPFRRLIIWAKGHVGPCCGFPGIVYDMGHYKAQSLHEIWHGEPMNRMREMMRTRDWARPCLQCQGTRVVEY